MRRNALVLLVMVCIVLSLLGLFEGAWASPAHDPHRQTVPTRKPTSTSTSPPTKEPSPLPTETPRSPMATDIPPSSTATATATIEEPTPSDTVLLTATETIILIQETSPTLELLPRKETAIPIPALTDTAVSELSSRQLNWPLAGLILGIVLVILGFLIIRRRNR